MDLASGILNRDALVESLRAMAPKLQRIAEEGEAWGMSPDVLNHLRPGILARAQELANLD